MSKFASCKCRESKTCKSCRVGGGAKDERLELIYNESVRAITLQASNLDEFRSRAGTIIQSASIAGGILGAVQIAKFQHFHLSTWIAVCAFGLVGLTTTAVLWPRWRWEFTSSPKMMLDAYMATGSEKSLADVTRNAAHQSELAYNRNDKRMTAISWLLAGACVSLVVEIVFFLVGLGQS